MNQEIKLKKTAAAASAAPLLPECSTSSTWSSVTAGGKCSCCVSDSTGLSCSVSTVLVTCSLRKLHQHSLSLGTSFLPGWRKIRMCKDVKHAAALFHS